MGGAWLISWLVWLKLHDGTWIMGSGSVEGPFSPVTFLLSCVVLQLTSSMYQLTNTTTHTIDRDSYTIHLSLWAQATCWRTVPWVTAAWPRWMNQTRTFFPYCATVDVLPRLGYYYDTKSYSTHPTIAGVSCSLPHFRVRGFHWMEMPQSSNTASASRTWQRGPVWCYCYICGVLLTEAYQYFLNQSFFVKHGNTEWIAISNNSLSTQELWLCSEETVIELVLLFANDLLILAETGECFHLQQRNNLTGNVSKLAE